VHLVNLNRLQQVAGARRQVHLPAGQHVQELPAAARGDPMMCTLLVVVGLLVACVLIFPRFTQVVGAAMLITLAVVLALAVAARAAEFPKEMRGDWCHTGNYYTPRALLSRDDLMKPDRCGKGSPFWIRITADRWAGLSSEEPWECRLVDIKPSAGIGRRYLLQNLPWRQLTTEERQMIRLRPGELVGEFSCKVIDLDGPERLTKHKRFFITTGTKGLGLRLYVEDM
jgi:hypothetical protein